MDLFTSAVSRKKEGDERPRQPQNDGILALFTSPAPSFRSIYTLRIGQVRLGYSQGARKGETGRRRPRERERVWNLYCFVVLWMSTVRVKWPLNGALSSSSFVWLCDLTLFYFLIQRLSLLALSSATFLQYCSGSFSGSFVWPFLVLPSLGFLYFFSSSLICLSSMPLP